jgi:FliI/YscN family ATPase
LVRPAPDPLARAPIDTQLATGIRALDSCLGIGVGQRIGLFAGPGLGKSTLLATLARHAASDVNVICLVGERGREVTAFIHGALQAEGLARSVVVLAPPDAPPMARVRALDAATAIAEWFRGRGDAVLLLVDSLTRVVRAKREVAFALGEPPARGGYPASAFTFLPSLIERTGNGAWVEHGTSGTGSITAVYTVLTENDDDDPVAEEARSLLDGHIVLSEKRARAGRWPAIALLRSVSRVFDDVVSADISKAAATLKRLVAAYEENEDLILMGAYRRGTSPETDQAIAKMARIEQFLCQGKNESSTLKETFLLLKRLLDIELI